MHEATASAVDTFPEQFIISIITEPPGAIAVLGIDGIPVHTEILPDLHTAELFAQDSFLTQMLHVLPDIEAVAKVCINVPDDTSRDGVLQLMSRSGVGYLIHLLRWMIIPHMVVRKSDWRPIIDESYGTMSAVEHIEAGRPGMFEKGELNEQQAEALLLAYTALGSMDWNGPNILKSLAPEAGEPH